MWFGEHYKALQMLAIGVRDKPMKMAKKFDGFTLPFGLNNEYGGNFKVGVPRYGGSKGAVLPHLPRNLGFQ